MSGKRRDDFVWIRPIEGRGSVEFHCGMIHVYCTREEPQEVTRAVWENFLKHRGHLEICQSPQQGE